MKSYNYQPPKIVQRMNKVKAIWIKDYERERRGKLIAILPTMAAYSIGFWSGSLGHGAFLWLETIIISICVWRVFKLLREVYKINI